MTTADQDALLAFANLHKLQAPRLYRDAFWAASEKLAAEFVTLATKGGLPISKTRDGNQSINFGSHDIVIFLDPEGGIALRCTTFQKGWPIAAAELEYDSTANAVVGKHVDPDIAPTPGERLPRVHPLKVLSLLAAKLIEEAQA